MPWQSLPTNLLIGLASLFGALTAGSIVRLLATRHATVETRRKRLASLRTWWLLAIVLAAACLAGRFGVCLLLAVTSALAMREFIRLVAKPKHDAVGIAFLYGVIPIQYAAIYLGFESFSSMFFPMLVLLGFSAFQVLQGEPQDYVRRTASLYWGSMFLVFGLSHAAMLVCLPAEENAVAGPAGWILLLLILTEVNDIAQAITGRRFGSHKKHRITPSVSPNKTWEGFLGGLVVTVVVATLLAPWLTTLGEHFTGPDESLSLLRFIWLPAIGAMIAISGFIGDINMSAVKRDVGVKDSSQLLPGMGGVIDRIDSLSVSAPVFFYTVIWLMS